MKKSGQWWVGKRVKVFVQNNQSWLHGTVVDYEQSQQLYSVQFINGQIALHHEQDLFLESKEENRSDTMSTPNFSAFQMRKRKKNNLMIFDMQSFGDSDANMSPRSETSDGDLSDSSKRRRLSLDDNDEQIVSSPNGSSENEDIPDNSSDSGNESMMDFSESLDMYEPKGKRAQSVSNSMADFKKMTSQFPRFDPPPSLLTCSGCGQDCAVDNTVFDVIPAQGDRSYIYKCPKCYGGHGKLQHLHKTWTEIALTAVYNLELTHKRQYFHSKLEICRYVDKNWSTICTGKTRTSTWWATLHAQITQNRHMFRTVSYGSGYWGIVHGEETPSDSSKAQPKHKPRTRIHREESSPKNDESDNEDKVRSPAVPLKGVTCHQCRNRKSVLVSCTEPGCSKRYCEGCLDKHYGMSLTELMERPSWKCVNCQGVCSCISCKRGRGEAPPFQKGNYKGGRPKNSSNSDSPKKRGRKARSSEDLAATKKRNLVSQLVNGDDEDEVPEIESSSDLENMDRISIAFSDLQTRSGFLPPKELLQGTEIINDIDISDLNDIRLDLLVDGDYEPSMPSFYFNQPQFIL